MSKQEGNALFLAKKHLIEMEREIMKLKDELEINKSNMKNYICTVNDLNSKKDIKYNEGEQKRNEYDGIIYNYKRIVKEYFHENSENINNEKLFLLNKKSEIEKEIIKIDQEYEQLMDLYDRAVSNFEHHIRLYEESLKKYNILRERKREYNIKRWKSFEPK